MKVNKRTVAKIVAGVLGLGVVSGTAANLAISNKNNIEQKYADDLSAFNSAINTVSEKICDDLKSNEHYKNQISEKNLRDIEFSPNSISIVDIFNNKTGKTADNISLELLGNFYGKDIKGNIENYSQSSVQYAISQQDYEKIVNFAASGVKELYTVVENGQTFYVSENGDARMYNDSTLSNPFKTKKFLSDGGGELQNSEVLKRTEIVNLVKQAMENGSIKTFAMGKKVEAKKDMQTKVVEISTPEISGKQISYKVLYAVYDANNLANGGKFIETTFNTELTERLKANPTLVLDQKRIEQFKGILSNFDYEVNDLESYVGPLKVEFKVSKSEYSKLFEAITEMEDDNVQNHVVQFKDAEEAQPER